MHETRTEWAPSVPRGQWCSTRPRHAPQPASAASQRPVPDLGRVLHPFHPTFKMTRHQPRVHSRSPARPSPRPWPPEGTRTLRLEPWAPHPAVTRDARQGGDRPPSTSRGSRHHNRNLLHRDPLTTCDFVSHAHGLALGRSPCDVGPRPRAAAHPNHGDRVDRSIEGPVAAAVEPVAHDPATAGLQRTGAGQRRECGVAATPARVGEAHDDLSCSDRADSGVIGEPGCHLVHDGLQRSRRASRHSRWCRC
jgi:hypothetical protein